MTAKQNVKLKPSTIILVMVLHVSGLNVTDLSWNQMSSQLKVVQHQAHCMYSVHAFSFRRGSYRIGPQYQLLGEAACVNHLQALLSDPRKQSSDHAALCSPGGLGASEWPILLLLHPTWSQWPSPRRWAGQKAVGSEWEDVWPVVKGMRGTEELQERKWHQMPCEQ